MQTSPTKYHSQANYDGVVLRLLTTELASYLDVLHANARDFESATGARVEIHAIGEYHCWYYLLPLARVDAESPEPQFDLFLDDHEFQYSLLPQLLPLDDLIKRFNYDTSGFLDPVHRFGDILPGQPEQTYGLPFRARVPMVFYRTDWIDEFPDSWEEFDRVLADNTGGERYGLGFEGVHYAHPFCRYEELSKMFFARYWSLGDPLLTPERQANEFTTHRQVVPAVTALSGGDYLLAWDSFGQGASDAAGARIDSPRVPHKKSTTRSGDSSQPGGRGEASTARRKAS